MSGNPSMTGGGSRPGGAAAEEASSPVPATWRACALTLLTGILVAIAIGLLLNPQIREVKATWATFYGDF